MSTAECGNCGVRLRLSGHRAGLPKVQCPACGFRMPIAAPIEPRDPATDYPMPSWVTPARWPWVVGTVLSTLLLQALAIVLLTWRLASVR